MRTVTESISKLTVHPFTIPVPRGQRPRGRTTVDVLHIDKSRSCMSYGLLCPFVAP